MAGALHILRTRTAAAAALLAASAVGLACDAGAPMAGASSPRPRVITAVGAENEYADVISQIGGRYVSVSAIMTNPNTDPHTFEASPSVARTLSTAQLVVQNGVGYDDFMARLEAGSPSSSRQVVDVQHLLGLPDSTPNPHLWYSPGTMPAVAKAVAADLSRVDPGERSYFDANVARFDRSLQPWSALIATIGSQHRGAAVATTEPVADYLLQAAGLDNKTPWPLQADIMNGIDPSPQAVTIEHTLLSRRQVKAFLYNRQVTDSITATFLSEARAAGIPVVAVYETMPTGYHYQSWMVAETGAVLRALRDRQSTPRL